MTSPFDILWNAIIQEENINPSANNLPANDDEAAKKALALFALKYATSSSVNLMEDGRICKNIELAGQAAKTAVAAVEKQLLFQALDRYNDAIRYCPSDSAELATFFRNRSEVLSHLNEKEAADTDAARSVGIIKDDRQGNSKENQSVPNKNTRKSQRNERKEKLNRNCRLPEKRNSIVGSGLEKIPSLMSATHSQIRFASQFVELKSDPDRGRYLVAAKEIPAGAVVILETAYACSPLPPYLTSNCSNCCSPLLSPIGCPHCAAVLFCNESCRDQCLEDFHRAECPVLQHLIQGKELTPMALLVYRTVIKGSKLSAAISQSDSLLLDGEFQRLHENSTQHNSPEFYNSDYRAAFSQVSNADLRHSADRFKRAVTAAYLTACLNTAIALTSKSLKNENAVLNDHHKILFTSAFFHHLQSSSCNAYQVTQQDIRNGNISLSEGLDIGGAIFPTVALLNHSCAPNVARHTHGSTCVVRTTRRIVAREEILDNYGPHFLSDEDVNERRRYLRLHYFFQCNCQACNEEWPSAVVLRSQPAKIICGGCRGLVGSASSPDELQSLQKCPQCRRKNNFSKLVISWRNFEGALPSLLSGDFEKALASSLKLLNTLNTCVLPPSNLQARATQVATLSWSLQGNRRVRL